MKKAALAFGVLLLLILCLWNVAVPERLISDLMENALSGDPLFLRTEGVRKGLFYNFAAEGIFLGKKGAAGGPDETLFVVRDVKGALDVPSLFMLRPELAFHGVLNGGEVKGLARLTGADGLVITAGAVSLQGMPLFEPLGISGDGVLSGNLAVQGNSGELKFSVKDLRLRSTSLGGVLLPLDLFHDAKGAVSIRDGAAEIQSFAMSGTGIYARVKGKVKGDDMNLSLELMTDASFSSGPLLQMMLEKYRVSPGYYVVPLKGGVPGGEG